MTCASGSYDTTCDTNKVSFLPFFCMCSLLLLQNSNLGRFLQEKGIPVVPSTPYIHNENLYSENSNCIIGDIARTIRIRACLPKRFWAEAYQFASTVHSMLLQKGADLALFETFKRRKPDFLNIHVFGCHAYEGKVTQTWSKIQTCNISWPCSSWKTWTLTIWPINWWSLHCKLSYIWWKIFWCLWTSWHCPHF